METFAIVIPARYASTRFPGKPLAKIGGTEMIVRVCRQAAKACDNVFVATDDRRIYDTVERAGFRAVMTSDDLKSGTDRVRQAVERQGIDASVIINLQGDEPFIDPEQVRKLMSAFDDADTAIATLARPYNGDYVGLADPNLVKVTFDDGCRALYFSRSVIPYVRGRETAEWVSDFQYHTHIGIYAYRRDVLRRITEMPQSSLEKAESLEQLRWLQAGLPVKVIVTDMQTIGIDTPDDLHAAELYLSDLELS